MPRISILIFLTLFSTSVFSQILRTKDFRNSKWFFEKNDSNLFDTDTIHLIKYLNPSPDWASQKFAESPLKYFGHGEYVDLNFNKNGSLQITVINKNYINSVLTARYEWELEDSTNYLSIYKDLKLIARFEILKKNEIDIPSQFTEIKDLKTHQMTLLRTDALTSNELNKISEGRNKIQSKRK